MDRLYVLVREDLSPGLRAAQAIHGVLGYSESYDLTRSEWYKTSNTVSVLGVKDEDHLNRVKSQAEDLGIRLSVFREPDLNDSQTCLVLDPHNQFSKTVVRGLKPI